MKFTRLFTDPTRPIEDQIPWKTVESKILHSDGSVVFHMPAVEVPAHWSQTATDILAQKYFRKAGVPTHTTWHSINPPDYNVPQWLLPRVPASAYHGASKTGVEFGSETSAKQVFHRLAGAWTYHAWREGYFRTFSGKDFDPAEDYTKPMEDSAQAFYDETYYMLAMQFAAPNSPQFFNTGLHWAYGISGPDSGQWAVSRLKTPDDINRLPIGAKYIGNGYYVERCSNTYERPQTSACFIQPILDDLVNPGGIMDLWTREVRLFKHGSGTGTNFSSIRGKGEPLSGGGQSSGLMSFLRIGDTAAGAIKSGGTTRRAAKMVVLDMDHPEIESFISWKMVEERKAQTLIAAGWSPDAAAETISGQNSNNSVRAPDAFLKAVDQDDFWVLKNRTNSGGAPVLARNLWDKICFAAWACGDPGVQFHDTIQAWNTCPNDGAINATNPCSEYVYLDNTACNLASLNLVKFREPDGTFNTKAFKHAIRFWTTVLDISVSMSSFPSAEIAMGSHNYRTLGLGYANLGGLLMRKAIAYDSDEGRAIARDITVIMHTTAYSTSSELASELGPFPRWEANQDAMLNVLRHHGGITLSNDISFRNAQVTLIAPTGTIALLMDCDTTGIEPAFALATHKKLAGGGTIQATNRAVEAALLRLGYTLAQTAEAGLWIEKGGELADMPPCNGQPFIQPEHLPIFATAIGKNALSPEAHIRMVAAIQPHLSGGVSKTVNMPEHATVADVDRIYRLAHKLGLKSISIYRDGSKVVQPLSATPSNGTMSGCVMEDNRIAADLMEEDRRGVAYGTARGDRQALLPRRGGYTRKFRVANQAIYLHTGEYPGGALGEIFITLSRGDTFLRSIMECFAKSISIGIQYGVPLNEFVDAFLHARFEPAGIVQGHENIKMCSSIVDLVFRDLGINYLKRSELGQTTEPHQTGYPTSLVEVVFSGEIDSSGNIAKVALAPEMHHTPYGVGDICWECGNPTLVRAGTCVQCSNCGANTGCG